MPLTWQVGTEAPACLPTWPLHPSSGQWLSYNARSAPKCRIGNLGARDAWISDIFPIVTSIETTLGGMEGITESTYWEPRLRSPWAVDVKTNGTLATISKEGYRGIQPLRLGYDGSARKLSGPSTQLVSVVSG